MAAYFGTWSLAGEQLHASEKMQFENAGMVILSSGCFKDGSGCTLEVLSSWPPITTRLLAANELL